MVKLLKLALGISVLFSMSQIASAATFTVTKVADTNDGTCDADCSLREAVAAAGASAENDTIQFSALFSAPQTITLALAEIIITSSGTLAINGPGANLLTISGNNASRIFTNNTGAVTAISNLRMTAGNGVSTIQTGRAGAVYNSGGTLTLSGVVLTANTAANGGALNNASTATLTLINCTVSNNSATGAGGGAQNCSGSTMNIVGTTFSGNVSNSTLTGGGAIQANGTLNIANSTFSGNRAQGGDGGGLYYNGQGLTMNNVTIAANQATTGAGGLHKSTSTLNANIRNTLIAGNTGGAGTPDVVGAFTSQGNNLIAAVGTSTGWVAADLLNRPAYLSPLADNGGATQTHVLLASSPAINAGQSCVTNASCAAGNPFQQLANDQRGAGFPRQSGGTVDIGAVESGFANRAQVAPFDFDGDGRTDYAVFRPSNTTWFVQRSTGGFLAQQFGLTTDRLTPADYDGDGRADIAVYRDNVVNNRSYFFILSSSTNTLRVEQVGATGDNPAVVGDYDGDGKADVAVFRSSDAVNIPCNAGASVWYYRPSGAPGVDFRYQCWGLPGDSPAAGDYDGDGLTDAAVFRASDSTWYIRQSSNNQSRVERWGTPADRRVPADYDGDGKTDLAVFRSGLWLILQSASGQPRFEVWGSAGDQLVAGDYDGDGRGDLALWRGGGFSVLRSASGQTSLFSFGTGGDAPVGAAYLAP